MIDEPQQTLEEYVRELADREEPHPSHFINSLNSPGPALYVLMRAERAQISNPAPALITFGHVIATENEAASVNPDDIIELIRERYEDDAEEIVEDFEEAMTEI
ncbi:hypothetical protein [uncultured Sphingomonas sp.]|uniref:hypothetical protein n=1 Tax=uncultured Sphingomonas sp. TaxID=158754 RepID=UPI0030DB657D